MIRKRLSVSSEIRGLFLKHGIKRHFDPKQILMEQDSLSKEVYYIAKGHVRAFYSNPDGDEITLFYLGENNLIYFEALTFSYRTFNNSQAITPVDIYAIPADDLLRLWSEANIPLEELFALLMARVSLMHDYICCTHFRESDKRVAYFLHSQYVHFGPTILYTHDQIAAICGINRISVNRAVNALSKLGILELGYRNIKIVDAEYLSRIVAL